MTPEQKRALHDLSFCDHPRRHVVATEPAKIVVCLECGAVEEDDVGANGHLAGGRRWRFPTRVEAVCSSFRAEVAGPKR